MPSSSCGLRWPECGPSALRAPVHVPQTHTIFVGPRSCARRHGLGGIAAGRGADQSYLDLDDADLACGRTEELVVDAVGRVRAARRTPALAWFIWLRCVHDLAGVDEGALESLREEGYPGERFAVCSMNPVAMGDGRPAPGIAIREACYRLVEPASARDRGVVALDCPDPAAFEDALAQVGLGPVRSLEACETYAEYQLIGRSCLVVAFGPVGAQVADGVAGHLGVRCVLAQTPEASDDLARRCRKALDGEVRP